MLIWREADLPRTHDLGDLLSRIRTAGVDVPPELLELAALTAFAVELRYAAPDTVSAESARTATRLAAAALNWAQYLIGVAGRNYMHPIGSPAKRRSTYDPNG